MKPFGCTVTHRRKPHLRAGGGDLFKGSPGGLRYAATKRPIQSAGREARDTGPDDCSRVMPKPLVAGAAAQVFITSGGARRHGDRPRGLAGQSASALRRSTAESSAGVYAARQA